MAIVGLGAASNGVGTPGSAFTVSYTLVAGTNRMVSASVSFEGTVDVTGVDFGGVAMVLVATSTQGTLVCQMWALLESALPANGTFDITVAGSSGGNTASITCGMHGGVMQQAQPPATVGGDTSANVNHDITIESHQTTDFVFWGMSKIGSTAYTDAECPVGSPALQINSNTPTGVIHRVSRSQNSTGVVGPVVSRCVDDEVATTFAGVAILLREAFISGPNPSLVSQSAAVASTVISPTLPGQSIGAGDNRLALLFIQTTGNERIAAVAFNGEPAALVTDGTITAEAIIDSGADDLVVSVFVVKETALPASGSLTWTVVLSGAQPLLMQSMVLQDAEQGNLAGISIASQATAVNPLVDFGGARVEFPGSLAFSTVGSVV